MGGGKLKKEGSICTNLVTWNSQGSTPWVVLSEADPSLESDAQVPSGAGAGVLVGGEERLWVAGLEEGADG